MTKAVLFDLFETLITESGWPVPRASSIGSRLGLDDDAFRVAWRVRRPNVVCGRQSLREALIDAARSMGREIPAAELDRVIEDRVRAKEAVLRRCDPEIVTMLRTLRQRGLRLAVISNCFREDVTAWNDCALAPHVDEVLFSFETGLAKPDPAVYAEACRRLGVPPAEAIFRQRWPAGGTGWRGSSQALWFRERGTYARTLAWPGEVIGIV